MIIDPERDDEALSARDAAGRIIRVILNTDYISDEILSAFPLADKDEQEEIKNKFLSLKKDILLLL